MVLGVVALVAGLSGSGSPTTGPTGSSTAAGPLPPLAVSAPPRAGRDAAACAKVLAALPVRVKGLDQRVVHTTPETPDVVAWGDPPVVLRCGVARPRDLHAGSAKDLFSVLVTGGPLFDVTSAGTDQVFTVVDRAAYISITIPVAYHSGPLPPLARAIASALPAVCTVPPAPTPDLCTRRS